MVCDQLTGVLMHSFRAHDSGIRRLAPFGRDAVVALSQQRNNHVHVWRMGGAVPSMASVCTGAVESMVDVDTHQNTVCEVESEGERVQQRSQLDQNRDAFSP